MRVVVKGPKMRRILAGRNWSQRDFARLLEVSPSTICLWLAGRRSPPPALRGRLLGLLGLRFGEVFAIVGDRRTGNPPGAGEQQAAAGGA